MSVVTFEWTSVDRNTPKTFAPATMLHRKVVSGTDVGLDAAGKPNRDRARPQAPGWLRGVGNRLRAISEIWSFSTEVVADWRHTSLSVPWWRSRHGADRRTVPARRTDLPLAPTSVPEQASDDLVVTLVIRPTLARQLMKAATSSNRTPAQLISDIVLQAVDEGMTGAG